MIDKKRDALLNINFYDSLNEYLTDNSESLEEFEEMESSGDIQEITLGTYNGVTNIFSKRNLNNDDILDCVYQDLHETDFYSRYVNQLDSFKDSESFDKLDWIIEYLELNEIFVLELDNAIYIKR